MDHKGLQAGGVEFMALPWFYHTWMEEAFLLLLLCLGSGRLLVGEPLEKEESGTERQPATVPSGQYTLKPAKPHLTLKTPFYTRSLHVVMQVKILEKSIKISTSYKIGLSDTKFIKYELIKYAKHSLLASVDKTRKHQ